MTLPRSASPRYKFDHSADQRDCALYYVDVLDHDTSKVMRGDYIGETARQPFLRFLEHAYDQPWGDLIVGMPRVDKRVFAGKAAVLEAEREAVEQHKPRLNYEWNLANPDRIPIWKQRAQRAERDAAKGVVSRWTLDGKPNPAYGTVTVTPERVVALPSRVPSAARKSLSRKAKTRLTWAAAVASTTLTAWLLLAMLVGPHWHGPWWLWPIRAALPWLLPVTFRPRKRDNRRAARIALLAALAVAWLA